MERRRSFVPFERTRSRNAVPYNTGCQIDESFHAGLAFTKNFSKPFVISILKKKKKKKFWHICFAVLRALHWDAAAPSKTLELIRMQLTEAHDSFLCPQEFSLGHLATSVHF
ncbi:unnamed protein product [Ixodes pacificus]